ncbi:ABC transporter substrate-binding protein [Halomonas sp. DN3]|uniref:ABC transporter substrate-binding protein n=1 Tax=Halomonas sp. DN3 TaxID=2953657 RepID=UPI0020A02AF9|nr:ABC transporter substrate-binding protein [Halomonas sp. DN3]USZ49585.1 ABC transporter substrate-binding protein [Halomonas sp. DN3]
MPQLLYRWLTAAALLLPGTAIAADEGPLEVGYMPILPVAQLFVMEGEGWTEEAGLELELTRFSSGPAMVQALASGDLDVMYFGIGPAMVARANGVPIKVLAAAIQEQIGLVARGELASLMADADPAQAIADFTEREGRRPKIATFPKGSVPDTVLRYWLDERLGIGSDAVEIVAMGADRVQQALLAGAVDAASTLEPILSTVTERLDDAQIVAHASDMLPGQPGAVLAARESLLEQRPDAVSTLLELHLRATHALVDTPQQVAPSVREFVGKRLVPLETVEAALSSPFANYGADPHAIVEGTRTMHDFQLANGTLKQGLDIDTLFDTRWYDDLVASADADAEEGDTSP